MESWCRAEGSSFIRPVHLRNAHTHTHSPGTYSTRWPPPSSPQKCICPTFVTSTVKKMDSSVKPDLAFRIFSCYSFSCFFFFFCRLSVSFSLGTGFAEKKKRPREKRVHSSMHVCTLIFLCQGETTEKEGRREISESFLKYFLKLLLEQKILDKQSLIFHFFFRFEHLFHPCMALVVLEHAYLWYTSGEYVSI